MEIVLNAQDVALNLLESGDPIGTSMADVPAGQVALVITQGTDQVFVVGRLLDIHHLVATGLSMPVSEEALNTLLNDMQAEAHGRLQQ